LDIFVGFYIGPRGGQAVEWAQQGFTWQTPPVRRSRVFGGLLGPFASCPACDRKREAFDRFVKPSGLARL